MSGERRQFPRLDLSADAIAIDEKGTRLGRVSQAGGGGMTIHLESETAAAKLIPGRCLRVTVVEPSTRASNTIDVIVRYRQDDDVGVEFITGP